MTKKSKKAEDSMMREETQKKVEQQLFFAFQLSKFYPRLFQMINIFYTFSNCPGHRIRISNRRYFTNFLFTERRLLLQNYIEKSEHLSEC